MCFHPLCQSGMAPDGGVAAMAKWRALPTEERTRINRECGFHDNHINPEAPYVGCEACESGCLRCPHVDQPMPPVVFPVSRIYSIQDVLKLLKA